jgi:hypothetical protein
MGRENGMPWLKLQKISDRLIFLSIPLVLVSFDRRFEDDDDIEAMGLPRVGFNPTKKGRFGLVRRGIAA